MTHIEDRKRVLRTRIQPHYRRQESLGQQSPQTKRRKENSLTLSLFILI